MLHAKCDERRKLDEKHGFKHVLPAYDMQWTVRLRRLLVPEPMDLALAAEHEMASDADVVRFAGAPQRVGARLVWADMWL